MLMIAGGAACVNGPKVVVIVPGAPPNTPENVVLKTVHKVLGRHVPKLQPPKIGAISLLPSDLLQRTKSKVATPPLMRLPGSVV